MNNVVDDINAYASTFCALDVEIVRYDGYLLKLGASVLDYNSYDFAIIFEDVDLISGTLQWSSDTINFVKLIDKNSDIFEDVKSKFNFKYNENYELYMFSDSSFTEREKFYYVTARKIHFINKKISVQELIEFSLDPFSN